jgi:zinc transporter ZupT
MQRQQHGWLAASISLAAGVMVFVSLTEGVTGLSYTESLVEMKHQWAVHLAVPGTVQ